MTPGERAALDQLRARTVEIVNGMQSAAADAMVAESQEASDSFALEWIVPLLSFERAELESVLVEIIGRLGMHELEHRAAIRMLGQILGQSPEQP